MKTPCLVDFYFLLSILCVSLILSRLIRATISVFFVPCCLVLLSFYLVYLTCLNLINGDGDGDVSMLADIETDKSKRQIKHTSSAEITKLIVISYVKRILVS